MCCQSNTAHTSGTTSKWNTKHWPAGVHSVGLVVKMARAGCAFTVPMCFAAGTSKYTIQWEEVITRTGSYGTTLEWYTRRTLYCSEPGWFERVVLSLWHLCVSYCSSLKSDLLAHLFNFQGMRIWWFSFFFKLLLFDPNLQDCTPTICSFFNFVSALFSCLLFPPFFYHPSPTSGRSLTIFKI